MVVGRCPSVCADRAKNLEPLAARLKGAPPHLGEEVCVAVVAGVLLDYPAAFLDIAKAPERLDKVLGYAIRRFGWVCYIHHYLLLRGG
jgi:hypothetical protein